jgi:2-polyprenyl-3-methyl-5-hydroxy-6-metoxy-1,4-benzoquinol methylase
MKSRCPTDDSQVYGSEAWLEARFRVVSDDAWGHAWKAVELKRYEFVLGVIRKRLQGESLEPLAETCLDIGCSTGHFSKRLSELFQRVVAVDACHTAVERAKLNYPGLDFRCAALPHLSFPSGAFKLVTCLEVLYYLDRDLLDLALEEVSRVLCSDGLVVFSALIGKAPYFTTQQFLAQISKTFEVEWCEAYGSQLYSALARAPSGYHDKLQKVEGLLLSCENEAPLPADLPGNWGKGRRRCLGALQSATRVPLCARGLLSAIRLQQAIIRRCLGWAGPVRLATGFTTIFNLDGTHTIVLASKRLRRPRSS